MHGQHIVHIPVDFSLYTKQIVEIMQRHYKYTEKRVKNGAVL